MSMLKTIVAEVVGLFVDDIGFALSILVWLAVVWLALPRLGLPSAWSGVILFVGLAATLLGSATRRARR